MPRELRTRRLLLRPFSVDDIDDVHRYRTSQQIQHHAADADARPHSRARAERFVRGVLRLAWNSDPQWAIELDGRAIGHVGLAISEWRQIADIGYALAESHRDQGLVTEAACSVIGYAFTCAGVLKVSAETSIDNIASWRVMEKLGMQREGVKRSYIVASDGTRSDLVHYGLLREEWEATRPAR